MSVSLEASSVERRRPSPTLSLVLVATACGLLLRLLLLGSKGLWLDEVRSIQVAQAEFEATVAGIYEKYHPPLYYMLLTPWLTISDNEFLLRLPSAAFGAATIPLAYALAVRLTDRKTALVSSWFVALSPLLVCYSQELRSYSLLVFLSTLACLMLVVLLETPTALHWIPFVAATTAALYLHYDAILLVPVYLILVGLVSGVGRVELKGLVLWLLALIAVGLAYIPWRKTPAMQSFVELLLRNRLYFAPLLERALGTQMTLPLPVVLPGALMLSALAGVSLSALVRRHGEGIASLRTQQVIQSLALALWVMMLILSVVPRGYTIKRHILVVWVPLMIGFAWVFSGAGKRRVILAAALSVSLVASLANIAVIPKPQWREAAQMVALQWETDDVVLVSPAYMALPFGYYAGDQVQMTTISGGDVGGTLQLLSAQYDRVWFAFHTADIGSHRDSIHGWLDLYAEHIQTERFHLVQVDLYQLD